MRCAEVTRQLQLYIDNQLTLEQVRALEAHIAECAACQHEMRLLAGVVAALHDLPLVAEPEDLTMRVMQRVAVTPQQQKEQKNDDFSMLRPSFLELVAAILLATIATLGIMWEDPSLRDALPFANGHDSLSLAFVSLLHLVPAGSMILWIVGALLGICITLVLAGSELRTQWFKAILDRLPV